MSQILQLPPIAIGYDVTVALPTIVANGAMAALTSATEIVVTIAAAVGAAPLLTLSSLSGGVAVTGDWTAQITIPRAITAQLVKPYAHIGLARRDGATWSPLPFSLAWPVYQPAAPYPGA